MEVPFKILSGNFGKHAGDIWWGRYIRMYTVKG